MENFIFFTERKRFAFKGFQMKRSEEQWKGQKGLFLISTPIGHLEDISLRALSALRHVDRILCEDTRVTRLLLSAYDIHKPCFAFHDHNESSFSKTVLVWLKEQDEAIALVSDRGTPLISDPGFTLVKLCYDQEVPVHFLPGPCAAVMAVVLSGLPCHQFLFQGFLPLQEKARQTLLVSMASLPHTLIFYEAPHRLAQTLSTLLEIFGDRPACILRELTKKFEQRHPGTLASLLEEAGTKTFKGECVLVVGGFLEKGENLKLLEQLLLKNEGPLSKKLITDLITHTGCSRNTIYRMHLDLKMRQ